MKIKNLSLYLGIFVTICTPIVTNAAQEVLSKNFSQLFNFKPVSNPTSIMSFVKDRPQESLFLGLLATGAHNMSVNAMSYIMKQIALYNASNTQLTTKEITENTVNTILTNAPTTREQLYWLNQLIANNQTDATSEYKNEVVTFRDNLTAKGFATRWGEQLAHQFISPAFYPYILQNLKPEPFKIKNTQ